MALRPILNYSVILLSIIEMLLKMSFYRLFSYFVDASFLDSARRHLKCFHLHLKIWLLLWLKRVCQKYQEYIYIYLNPESFQITENLNYVLVWFFF